MRIERGYIGERVKSGQKKIKIKKDAKFVMESGWNKRKIPSAGMKIWRQYFHPLGVHLTKPHCYLPSNQI